MSKRVVVFLLKLKHCLLVIIASIFFAGSINKANAVDCNYWKNIYDSTKNHKTSGVGAKLGLATISSSIIAIQGCMNQKKLPFETLESEPFSINRTGKAGVLRVVPWTNGEDDHLLELWIGSSRVEGWTSSFRLLEPVTVYLSDKYYTKSLFRIEAVGGKSAGSCLNIDKKNQVSVNGICIIGDTTVPILGITYTNYPVLWDIEEVGGEVRFHAYKPDSHETDWHGGRYPVYHYAGSLGLMESNSTQEKGYIGWTDVLPSNVRTWSVYPGGSINDW